MHANAAIFEALNVFKQPAQARYINRNELPSDMLTLIKVAAGDQATIELCATLCGESAPIIQEAASFFLQQSIAKAGNDHFRTLGLSPQATKEELRSHKRWLLKWLHPDRNPQKWESALFARVAYMAQRLEDEMSNGSHSIAASHPQTARTRNPTQLRLHRQTAKQPSIIRHTALRTFLRGALKFCLGVLAFFGAVALLAYLFGFTYLPHGQPLEF